MNAKLHSVETTAERLSISIWKVFQLIREGDLRSVKIGARRLIPESAIDDYVAGLQAQAQPPATADNVSA